MNRQEYQEKYAEQLKNLNLEGFYKIASTKDTAYYERFLTGEMLDFYHLGTVTYGVFFNPDTQAVVSQWETDWDREGLDNWMNEDCHKIYGCPKDVRELYYDICKQKRYEALEKSEQNRLRLSDLAVKNEYWWYDFFRTGDTVEVYKGRKLPVGSVHKVVGSYRYTKDGMCVCTYLNFEDGTRTSVKNCKIIELRPFEEAVREHKDWLNLEDR